MRKYWKWIIAAIALLLIGLLAWLLIDYFSVPRLPPWEKEKVEQAYFKTCRYDEDLYEQLAIIWYDENGYVEEDRVWRYVGEYGDCYAFLEIGDNQNGFWEEVPIPYPIGGLSRIVYYPIEAQIVLYHTKREFTYQELCNYSSPWHDSSFPIWYLMEVHNRNLLLTDEQFEQLTQDIEKIAAEHE